MNLLSSCVIRELVVFSVWNLAILVVIYLRSCSVFGFGFLIGMWIFWCLICVGFWCGECSGGDWIHWRSGRNFSWIAVPWWIPAGCNHFFLSPFFLFKLLFCFLCFDLEFWIVGRVCRLRWSCGLIFLGISMIRLLLYLVRLVWLGILSCFCVLHLINEVKWAKSMPFEYFVVILWLLLSVILP